MHHPSVFLWSVLCCEREIHIYCQWQYARGIHITINSQIWTTGLTCMLSFGMIISMTCTSFQLKCSVVNIKFECQTTCVSKYFVKKNLNINNKVWKTILHNTFTVEMWGNYLQNPCKYGTVFESLLKEKIKVHVNDKKGIDLFLKPFYLYNGCIFTAYPFL